VTAQGWYRDPYGTHEYRYYSDGQPTKLVRDGRADSYDPPPCEPPGAELDEEPAFSCSDGDQRRADDPSAGSAAYDPRAAFRAAVDTMATYGPIN
jgi:hypothetical protein